jgi:hypothetical protein
VTRLRKEIGLLRRMGVFERNERDAQLFQVLQEELNDRRIEGYGRRLLHDYFRKNGQLVTQYLIFYHLLVFHYFSISTCSQANRVVRRDTLFAMLHILNPKAIFRRIARIQSKKGEYIVPGPDYIWSIDGHNKLSPFRIDIYVYIDAYSRAIIWVYISISNRTSHSVVQQYLITCARLGYIPIFFRADKGSKLPMIVEAYFCFSRLVDPSVLRVQDYFYFGKSTKNQRIKS